MTSGKESMQEMQVQSLGQKTPWRREWHPTPVFMPGKSHGQRSLVGCSARDGEEPGAAEPLSMRASQGEGSRAHRLRHQSRQPLGEQSEGWAAHWAPHRAAALKAAASEGSRWLFLREFYQCFYLKLKLERF